ncbi:serine/threonine-protein phosphatase [Pseudomonas sp. SAICEU22]|uniref:Serine/threonine-protein phosphatase n=1 Tax=Pseudomonas agronomica TaxID=2979328 RepID=A0ABT3F6K0_9PSED|nr:PP2C family serine/threonine-protein phosphatase [Pseudomonas agronomica]MCW1244731.1 serine/threonine-protein phosphatase [Pseudomonas agronomica]
MHHASHWRSAARTDTGKVRQRNEDAFLECPKQGLWAVADGMGGHSGGDIASQLIVANLAELPTYRDFDARLNAVRQCLRWTNRRLSQELTVTAANPLGIMGSTVAALLLEGRRAACVWAGDSRCYLWRRQRLYQLSRDHSLRQQWVVEGRLSLDQANAHPAAKALTRAIGASKELKLEVLQLDVQRGDKFLLCTDGLYQDLGSETLGDAMGLSSPSRVVECLFEEVLNGAARDNLTAVVICA